MTAAAGGLFWAPRAWVGGAWADDVLLRAGADGRWAEVQPGTPVPPAAERLPAPVMPALVNAHMVVGRPALMAA